jgi:hypothetical protein
MITAADVEQQFARPFVQEDWPLFKAMADSYLQESARLKRKDVDFHPNLTRHFH